MHLKQYFIDLAIITTAVTAKLTAYFTGFTFGIGALDLIGKILYILVLLITGFTAVYRFRKELKEDKEKSKHTYNEQNKNN